MGGARGFDRERDDFYPTPAALLEPLIAHGRRYLANGVWEPACGDGAICRVMAAHGIQTVGTDLVERGYGVPRVDFLMEHQVPAGVDAIVTNPPFRLWREFAEAALHFRLGYVALLGRLQLLEGKRMSAMFQRTQLTRVLVSAGRVNMLPPGAEDKGHNGMIAWAWFVWERDAGAPAPTLEWFTPVKP